MSWPAWTATPGWAAAEPGGTFAFAWHAPEGCPSQAQIRSEIVRLLGGSIPRADGGDLEVHAEVEHGVAWSVALTTRHAGRTGSRSIAAPSCQSVAEATALIIALMIDPDAVAAHAQDAEPAPPPAPSLDADGGPPAVAHSSQPMDWLVGVHTQVSLGTLPGVDVGMGVGVGLHGRRWSMEMRGTYGLRRDQVARSSALPGAYGRFQIWTGALSGCFNLGTPGVALGPCAVAEAGVVSAEGYGPIAGAAQRAPWVALGAGGYLSFALGGHVRATLHGDVLLPVWRPAYVFSEVPGAVFRAPAVGGRALASIGWRF
jgi:hypothetical protein